MKNVILLLMTILSLSAFAQKDSLDKTFNYPIKEGDEQWMKLANTHNRIAALQIPSSLLKEIPTEKLLDVCLDYPYLTSVVFCNDYQRSAELLVSQFNGFQELLNRKDIVTVLLNKERNMIDDFEKMRSYPLTEQGKFSFQWLIVDLLFIQKEVKTQINEQQKAEFNEIYKHNQSFRCNHLDVFKGASSISESLLCKDGILIGDGSKIYHPQYQSVTIYTPHYSVVPNAKKLSNSDNPLSPTENAQISAHIFNAYDSAQVIEPNTFKYDTAGWTWHTSETGEKVLIVNNGDAVYRSDGSYIQVPKQIATKVIYGSNNNFSATIDTPTWYISKWGMGGPLVRHHPTSLPDGTDTFFPNTNYYPTGQKAYYMRNPNLSISGPKLIQTSGTYSIQNLQNLPAGYNISWSLTNSSYNNPSHLVQNFPEIGKCIILRDQNQNMMDATLKAVITYNGVTVDSVKMKHLYAYSGFWGHYTSGNLSGDINYTLTFGIRANATTYIKSPNFYGATVSYSSSGATPTIWGFSPSDGDLTFVTTNTNAPVMINVNDVFGNSYLLYAFASNQYGMNISNGAGGITVTLVEDGDVSKDFTPEEPWTVEIISASTRQVMASLSSTSRSETISTAGWPKGIYVVKVTIGKEELTEKMIVK